MTEKVKVNVIYSPQVGEATCPRFENEKGELWMNPTRKFGMHNVSMGFYSANYPEAQHPDDSFYAVEPMCVSERDYETDFVNKFKYIFTWATEAFKNTEVAHKVIPINHPSCNGVNEHEYEKRKTTWKKWEDRSNEVVLIANNKSSNHFSELYSLRTQLAQWIDSNCNEFNVSWYAQSPHVPGRYFKGRIDGDKGEILKNVKFSICSENCYDSKYSYNYFTEKMPEVWFSGAVPIYTGCHNIDSFGFHKDSYIDLRNYFDINTRTIKYYELVKELNSFNQEKYDNYLKAVEYNVYNAKLFNLISDERVMAKMIETFWKEKNEL